MTFHSAGSIFHTTWTYSITSNILSDQYVAVYLVNPIKPLFTTEYVTGFTLCLFKEFSSLYNLWSGPIIPKSDEILTIVPPFYLNVQNQIFVYINDPVNPTAISCSHIEKIF